MKNTIDNTPKIAIFNMSNHGMNSEFNNFVRNLSRTGHELVACGDTANHILNLGLPVTKTGRLVTRDCGFSKITVGVFDRHVKKIEYLRLDGGTTNTSVEELIYNFLDNNPVATIITDSADYEWLIKKYANVHGVRKKDKNWLAVKASIMFSLECDQVLGLLARIQPREPSLRPAY